MIYTGKFCDRKNNTYSMTFHAGGGETKLLRFGTKPILVKYDGTSDVFKPIKYGSGTISLLIKEIPESLYTATRQGVTCEVKKEDVVIFKGYVSPNSFNQPFPSKLVDFEVEVEDCLCTLDTIKYQRTGTIISFADIISKAVTLAGLSPNNVVVAKTMTEELSDLYISEQNFFDEDGAAMTYKEILEEMMTYLNMTMCQVGERVVITDMVAMKDAHFGSLDMNTLTFVGLPDISMSEVYNKIKVRSSLYNFDNLIDDMTSEHKLIDSGKRFSGERPFGKSKVYYSGLTSTHPSITIDCLPFDASNYDENSAVKGALFNGHASPDGARQSKWSRYFGARVAMAGKPNLEDIPLMTIANEQFCAYGKGYFQFNISFYLSTSDVPAPNEGDGVQTKKGSGGYYDNNGAIYAVIRIGDKYFRRNIFFKDWIDEPFYNTITPEGTIGEYKFNEWQRLKTDFFHPEPDYPTSGIVMPVDELVVGDIEINIYGPRGYAGNLDAVKWVFIKDAKLTFNRYVPENGENTQTVADLKSTDTLWENVIDELNVAEKSDIDLRIATDCEKGLSFAAVLKKVGTKFEYLKTLTKGSDVGAAEEHLINACYQQYKLPRKIINATLNRVVDPHTIFNESQKKYMINSMEIDYCNNESVVQLIELSND